MTPRYPGARWYGIGGQGGSCSHRACSWHEAVTTSGVENIAGWVREARACHGFTAKDGDAGQFADFHESVAGVLNGNSEVLTWENWDGLVVSTGRTPDGSQGPNDIDWTPQQFERNADIMAWMVDGLGIPLHLMQNTEERGHGPHRLGVPQAGGNVKLNYGPTKWTSHPGKECPGDKRVLALPAMLRRAEAILSAVRAGKCTWLPQGPVNLAAALARTGGLAHTGVDAPAKPQTWKDPDMAQLINAEGAIYEYGAGHFRHVGSPAELAEAQKYGIAPAGNARVVSWDEANRIRAYCTRPQTGMVARKPAPKPPAPAAKTYTVKTNDTLSSIAAANKTTWQVLAKLNAIANPDVVDVGKVLKLPN